MESKSTLSTLMTFAASVVVGCGAAVAIASAAAVSQAAPSLRPHVEKAAPADVVRLAPVVVTISRAGFDQIQAEGRAQTEVARSNDARKVTRG